jgi:hypothetical protein
LEIRTEQALAADGAIACFSSNFLALRIECLSLGAGEQQRYAANFAVAGDSMKGFLRLAVYCFCFILFSADASFAKEWRGIVPLRSTRGDVARLYKHLTGASLFGIGLPHDTFNIAGEGMINIRYSLGRCVEGWKVKRDTVVSVTIYLTKHIPFADMKTELENLPHDEDDSGAVYYKNKREGIYYVVQDRKVTSVTYEPSEMDRNLVCKQSQP